MALYKAKNEGRKPHRYLERMSRIIAQITGDCAWEGPKLLPATLAH
jgi:hypothetical protein